VYRLLRVDCEDFCAAGMTRCTDVEGDIWLCAKRYTCVSVENMRAVDA